MSCFSADQQQSFAKGKGANHHTQPKCVVLLPLRVSKNIKPEFRKYVKSQTPILSYQEQTRLKNAAKVMTVNERLEAIAKREEMSKRQHEQAERTRDYFRHIDERRLRNTKVNTENVFGVGEKQQSLELAFLAKQEQEEEVKTINRFILHAKCQAVRDAQIKEKKDIERNQRDEQIRLERKVVEENAKSLAKEDILAMNQKERSEKYAREIREQLLQRENFRFVEAERSEEEAKVRRAASAALQREEELNLRQEKDRRQKFRDELDRVVEMSNLFKKMLHEQELETDLRIAAYIKEKQEREKILEREKELSREELERKQQLLYQIAQKRLASKTQREELNYIREQEYAEREYRLREKESAMRRKRLEDDIKETRLRQSQEMKTRQALQVAREEKDFMLMIESLKHEEEELRKKDEQRKKQREYYLAEIKRQISDKATNRRRLSELERNETKLWRDAERSRLEGIKFLINSKLAAMREACLPEQYIKDIERQIDKIIKRRPHK